MDLTSGLHCTTVVPSSRFVDLSLPAAAVQLVQTRRLYDGGGDNKGGADGREFPRLFLVAVQVIRVRRRVDAEETNCAPARPSDKKGKGPNEIEGHKGVS